MFVNTIYNSLFSHTAMDYTPAGKATTYHQQRNTSLFTDVKRSHSFVNTTTRVSSKLLI